MLISSRAAGLILSASISLITSGFLSMFKGVPPSALIVTSLVSFSSSYLLIYITLDFVIFREINKVNKILDELKHEHASLFKKRSRNYFLPLRKLNDKILAYALIKEKEINKLRKMETFRKEFLANVSHELKTPIFSAQGFVLTLLDGAIKDKSVRKPFLKKASKSLDGLNMLVQDLLTISQMETGDIKMHYEHFDICHQIMEAIEQLEGRAKKKKIEISFNGYFDEGIFVYADYHRIYQVLVNLISNGITYTSNGGRISIDFELSKSEVTVYIKDTGIGIPANHLKRIFERFYRVDKSRSKETGGTGLGLSIVKHIIEAHDSNVVVSSTLGKGSSFGFKLKKGDPEKTHLFRASHKIDDANQ